MAPSLLPHARRRRPLVLLLLAAAALVLLVATAAPRGASSAAVEPPGQLRLEDEAMLDVEFGEDAAGEKDDDDEGDDEEGEEEEEEDDDGDEDDPDKVMLALLDIVEEGGLEALASYTRGATGETQELLAELLMSGAGGAEDPPPLTSAEPSVVAAVLSHAQPHHADMIEAVGEGIRRHAVPLDEKQLRREAREAYELRRSVSAGKREPPAGHLGRLGEHAEPQETVIQYDYERGNAASLPTAREFWERHVYGYRPALFRGLAARAPAHELWDEQYLKERYGNLTVMFERRIEDRRREYTKEPMPMRMDEIMANLSRADIYAISCAPHAMLDEVEVPPFMMGGRRSPGTVSDERRPPWVTPVNEVGLWLSRNKTRSQAHRDQPGILNCAYGKASPDKQWLMWDTRRWGHLIPGQARNFDRNNPTSTPSSDFSDFDVSRADFASFPEFASAPFMRFTQRPGDCVYIPPRYFHQVSKDRDEFHAAVSFMVEGGVSMDEDSVDDVPPEFFVPASLMDHAWYFEGRGVVPIGYLSPQQACTALWHALRHAAVWGVTKSLPRKARFPRPRRMPSWASVPGEPDPLAAGGGCQGDSCESPGAEEFEEREDLAVDASVLRLFVHAYLGGDDDISTTEVTRLLERLMERSPPGTPEGMVASSTLYDSSYEWCQSVAIALSYDEPLPNVPYHHKPAWLRERDEAEFYRLLEEHQEATGSRK